MPAIMIALAQENLTVGDIGGNRSLLAACHARAGDENADLVVFSELAGVGYPPEDLIFVPAFRRAAMEAVLELAALTADGPAILTGGLWEEDGHLYNCAFLLEGGEIVYRQPKHHLPNYGVFDEKRVFSPGPLPDVPAWRGIKLGIFVCEDMWGGEAPAHLARQKPDLLISLNASPFESGKQQRREALAARIVRQADAPLLYLNQTGGQDELVFDGGSFAMDANGEIIQRLYFFEPHESLFSYAKGILTPRRKTRPHALPPPEALLFEAMKCGLRDYVRKNGFPGVVLGLSGGIDSALSACVAAEALGPGHVHCLMLPSPYTSPESLEDAATLAAGLGVRYGIIPITEGMEAAAHMLQTIPPSPLARENIQSRLRGLLLMAISNTEGKLLITTGNKSEMAVGYATLYGDMCGAYSVLKDLYKTEVYRVARWFNAQDSEPVIPERILTRPPSAELRENQRDEDSLPPYDVLDPILRLLVEGMRSVGEIVAEGFEREMVENIARLLYASEYKRRQSPPGVKLTPMAFGRDRRFPLTNRFRL